MTVFFQSFGPETANSADNLGDKARTSLSSSGQGSALDQGSTRRKRVTALSLAVAMTNPAGFIALARAGDTPATGTQSLLATDIKPGESEITVTYDNDTLRLASDQFKGGEFEEALATLQSVKVDSLSAGDKSGYTSLLSRVNEAVEGRKAARATFEQGEQALAAGKTSDALTSYRSVAGNKFADAGTRNKSLEQIALAEEQLRNIEVANKAAYQDARALLAKGDLAGAKAEFQKLSDAGFKPGLFQRSPADYLQEINGKMGMAAPAAAPAAAPTAAAAPMAAPAPAAEVAAAGAVASEAEATAAKAKLVSSTAAYDAGLAAYRKGDWIEARKQFTVAQEAGYKNGLFDRGPAFYLRLMNEKEQADAAKMASGAAAAPMASSAQTPAVTGGSIIEIPTPAAHTAALAGTPAASPTAPMPAAPMVAAPMAAAPVVAPAAVVAPEAAPVPAASTAVVPVPISPAPVAAAPMAAPAAAPMAAPMAQPMTPVAPAMTPVMAPAMVSKDDVRKAEDLVTQARAAQARGDLLKAADLYAQAVATDPSNTAARAGQADVNGQLAAHATSGGLLTEQEKAINARRQLVQYQFDTAIAETKADIQAADFAKAQTALNQAKVSRSSDPGVFSPAELTNFDTTVAATQADLEKARETRSVLDNDQRSKDTTARALTVAESRRQEKERQVAGLIRTTRQAIEEQRYQDALKLLDQILVIDPRNDYATGVRQLVEDKAIVQEQYKYKLQFDQQYMKTLNSLDEKRIPYDDFLRYPENWPDISARRDAEVGAANGFGGGSAEAMAVLDKRIPELKFDNAAFGDAVDFMRDIAEANGANLVVRWKKLEAAGVERTTPVTLRLSSVRFGKALDMLLENVGASAKLGYAVDEGVIVVSTDEDLAGERKLKVYDVRDLLFDPAQTGDDKFPKLLNQQQSQSSSAGSTFVQSGNSSSPFSSGGGGNNTQDDQAAKLRLDELMTTIKDQTGSDQWSDGGGQGDIKTFNETLLVSTTVKNHGKVQDLLDKLRSQSSVQVAIEARFLTVQKNFLDEFGINWNLNLNINGVNSPLFGSKGLDGSQPFTNTIPVSQQSGTFTSGPSTGAPGSLGGIISQPSIQTAVSFLDDFGVDLFIRATQASVNSTSLSAPRITLFSGSVAEVEVTQDQYYVSNLTPIVSANSVGLQPTVTSIKSGTHLRVRATVSQDRKYVSLNIYPELIRLRALQNFQIQSVSTPTSNNGGTATPIVSTGTIQLPLVDTTTLSTSARVPDGGTLILGGQIISAEIEQEAGVPVLSKIPFIKRLFTNRSTAKDEQVILILVKPTIIISEEQENKQFPLLNSRPQ